MAEGIARSLAPEEVRISSAGSNPTGVREEAVLVLREIGIDISHHGAKGLDEIDIGSVDAVITLCAEEVCPVLPGEIPHLHWPLPDPASRGSTENERLASFREVRDELLALLRAFFSAPASP